MICPYCGRENSDNLEICGFCGGPLLVTTHQPAMESQAIETAPEALPAPAQSQVPDQAPLSTPPVPTKGIYGNKVWWIVAGLVFICLVLSCIALVVGLYRFVRLSGLLNPATEATVLPLAHATSITTPPIVPEETMIPVITQKISLQQTPGLLFSDDFSDQNSGWDQVEETSYSTRYYEGAYRMVVNVEMMDIWTNPGDQIFGDVLIEVDATKNGGPDDNDFGLICRYQDVDNFYYAVVSSDGYYGISKVSAGATELLGRENLDYSELIHQGQSINHLRFDCVGNSLTLYVNNQLLDQQTDADYPTGNIGLIAGTFNTQGTDILFDNFYVYSP